MKHEYALDFAPPFVGLDNELYNTFRLGTSWSKRLAKGDEVYIQSSKDKLIFSKACRGCDCRSNWRADATPRTQQS